MTRRSAMACGVLLQLLACNGKREDTAVSGSDTVARPVAPAESLVATAPGGIEIWFTLARQSASPEGVPCTDRTMEIRNGASRIPVPLLYTGSAPELVNDTTIRARLSNQCTPGDAYLVNLKTGRPVRER